MRYPPYIENKFVFPPFYRVKIDHPARGLENPGAVLEERLSRVLPQSGIRSGHRVAIGVGSRGIANISGLMKVLCRCIRQMGANPSIIPAMGSHGNATAAGQTRVLEQLGITQSICGAPIVSSMAVDRVGAVMGEVPVYFSRDALAMDHTICINRIKPHTKFKGAVESGLYKMLCVGMGKHEGALVYHNMALKYGFSALLKAMGDEIIDKGNFCFGIALVEDFFDNTMAIETPMAAELFEKEEKLLAMARRHFPRLPFNELEVLVVQEIGKEISGSGMDPNVTGRTYDLMEDDFSKSLRAGRIAVLNLSRKTAGNAIGLGNADIITDKVFNGLDYEATLMNAMTSMSLRKAFIPIRLPNDEKAIQAAFSTLGPMDPSSVRAVIIRDTRHVQEFWASQALLPQLKAMDSAEVLEKALLGFDENGELVL
jgi:hypothetical protein